YWPGITNDIQTLLGDCRTSERNNRANRRETLIPQTIPELCFQKKPYVAVVDNYSKCLEIKRLASQSNSCHNCAEVFSTHCIPDIIFGDNNPLDSYECREYVSSIGRALSQASQNTNGVMG
ncbi:hypothetical protein FOCC_FOCC016471, partial [Frankliniella occidentalis]